MRGELQPQAYFMPPGFSLSSTFFPENRRDPCQIEKPHSGARPHEIQEKIDKRGKIYYINGMSEVEISPPLPPEAARAAPTPEELIQGEACPGNWTFLRT